MATMTFPRYPGIQVAVHSQNPLALVAAVREAMRQARIGKSEIRQFSEEALDHKRPERQRAVCHEWVRVLRD